jgi:molybdopterin/thiamine biosynthesis adenylyltransferase
MDEQDARWEIAATLKERGFRHVGPKPDQYRGSLTIGHVKAEIDLDIRDLDFVTLPTVEFVDRKALPLRLIAHLEQGSGLCYADRTLLRLDRFQPGPSILRILEEAEKTIAKSLAGQALAEVAREYPRYWKGTNVQVLIPKGKQSSAGYLAVDREAGGQVLLLDNGQTLPRQFRKACDVRIVGVADDLVPAAAFVSPSTLSDLELWHNAQAVSGNRRFDPVLATLAEGGAIFYSALNGWVGCRLEMPADLKLLAGRKNRQGGFLPAQLGQRKEKIALIPYHGSEASLEHVTTRNLRRGINSLRELNIALFGCGTIGSYLGRFLVQSGAGNEGQLIVVDNQPLAAGNLGRHLLNFGDIGSPKASALAANLRTFHPDLDVAAVDGDIRDVLPRVMSFDLVIDATGAESVSDFLNTKAIERRRNNRAFNLLHVWLFGNGIAAQSFLNVGEGFACYRCLRPNLAQPWLNDPRKNVNDIGEVSPASCGDGPYVAFDVSAPVIAATLALQAALDFADEKHDPRLRNALIDTQRARRLNDKSPQPHSQCPACG